MRTLFISNVIGDQLDTGCLQRVFHMLQALARVSDVTFVAAAPNGRWTGPATPFRSVCKEMYFYPRESFAGWNWDATGSLAVRRLQIMGRMLATEEPELFQWFRSQAGAALVRQLCERQFDLVWVERFYSISLLPQRLKARVVVDLDDLEHRKLSRELSIQPSGPKKMLQRLEQAKLRRFERNLWQLPYEYVVCSEIDKQILGSRSKVWVIPNGVEVAPSRPEPENRDHGPVIVFIGVMDYAPNCDAAEFFARKVMPLIRRSIADAKFQIVGRNPTPAVRALDNGDSISVTGTVPDVEPFLCQSSLVVAPLRVGGGTRIKILEAMAHQRAVVSTTIGAEGLDVKPGRDLMIADSAEGLAEACVLLLNDSGKRRELASHGYELVRAKYDWPGIQQRVEKLVAQEGTHRRAGRPEELIPACAVAAPSAREQVKSQAGGAGLDLGSIKCSE